MATLRSGLVIAGGYADKIRRALFAQLRDRVKSGELSNSEVARAAGELNRFLFELLVNKLNVDKGDVVRVSIDYDVEESTIKWDYRTLQVQVWRRVPDEEVARVLEESVERAGEILAEEIRFEAVKLGDTDTEDIVYEIRYGGKPVGALLVTPLDGEIIVRGAVAEPTPLHLKRTRIEGVDDPDDYIRENISAIMQRAENVERREAERVVREITSFIRPREEEEEEEEYA
ncbi:MAG: DUF2258 domain-containing protein [Desulfurococcales archaeon]|nr:DUF2258 domain-containing protein [Desulfurococcales archaeon]